MNTTHTYPTSNSGTVPLPAVLRRIATTPRQLYTPTTPPLVTAALVSDLLNRLGGHLPTSVRLGGDGPSVAAIATWMLDDDMFAGQADIGVAAAELFCSGRLEELGRIISPEQFVHDPDRREELARVVLDAIGLRPAGENATVAADRLAALDSVEQTRLLAEAREAQQRAEQVQQAMRRRAAREAAARPTRE